MSYKKESIDFYFISISSLTDVFVDFSLVISFSLFILIYGWLLSYNCSTTVGFPHPSLLFMNLISLLAIAKKRSCLIRSHSASLTRFGSLNLSKERGSCFRGTHHALKKAFLSCLQCKHTGAAPVWFCAAVWLKVCYSMLFTNFHLALWFTCLWLEITNYCDIYLLIHILLGEIPIRCLPTKGFIVLC